MDTTPKGNRLHVGIFGKRNAGKSSLINAICGQNIAIVSEVAGTTTDPIYKAMEINGIGAVMFIDTAGFDDFGGLGELRVDSTLKALEKADVALLVFKDDENLEEEKKWIEKFKASKTPYVIVYNAFETINNTDFYSVFGENVLTVNAKTNEGIGSLVAKIVAKTPEDFSTASILNGLCKENDVVMLVMPQDESAPKGRLILPQAQTIRELLDTFCTVVCVTPKNMVASLNSLKNPPNIIITDSQCFSFVFDNKPEKSKLTSFSVLFAGYKGDIQTFINGANKIDSLNANSKVLISEACSHSPIGEDIGRVKIPNLLKKKFGNLTIDVVSGGDFTNDISKYDLIIHCGACMFNRKLVLNRIEKAKNANVAITNYGIALAKLNNILDKITY